jgi:hypothetical protein
MLVVNQQQPLIHLATTNMFTEEEKQIIELGKQNGKSPIEVKRALAKYRSETGYVPPQTQTASQASTIGSRVSGVIQKCRKQRCRCDSG